jgi:hypothetical protein
VATDQEIFARRIVDRIIADLTGRSGLGDEWNEIDANTLAEIRQTWTDIVISEANRD